MELIEEFFRKKIKSEYQEINIGHQFLSGHSLIILREDQIHPYISGNKYRKLKYNLLEARKQSYSKLLTFGGAFSNHIAAVAALGKEVGFDTIGVIRGEELVHKAMENPTLSFALECGMQLEFVTRKYYSSKNEKPFIDDLRNKYGEFFVIPEGGTNSLAVKGCEEILNEDSLHYDYICVAVGTGGTVSGLLNASLPHQQVLGFSVLKGIFQSTEVRKYSTKTNFEITDAYSFGGYAKIDSNLIRFMNTFKKSTGIQLDPVYTAKMMFGIFDLIKKGFFKENSRILAVHTGGLQGITGMNKRLKEKNLPQIIV
jgi:1-aminocyclopropane-1-carboxylate deaminase